MVVGGDHGNEITRHGDGGGDPLGAAQRERPARILKRFGNPRALCLPKTSSRMTRGWAYCNEAADGRVSDPAAVCQTVEPPGVLSLICCNRLTEEVHPGQ